MKNSFFKRHSLLIKVFVPIFIIVSLVLPLHQIQAFFLGLATSIAGAIFALYFQIIVIIAWVILGLSSIFLSLVTSPSFINLPYTSGGIVGPGWEITRNFANMGFVFALLVIGLATALRIGEYHAKKTLPMLVGMILLINFTPVICGLVVDASNILMNFFLEGISSFSSIMNLYASQVSAVLSSLKTMEGWLSNHMDLIARSIAFSAFSILTAFFFFLFSILFIMRYVAIWMLVILSPLAFFANVLPNTRKLFSAWWSQFFQWCFVGVSAAFFLYLAEQLIVIVDTGSGVIGTVPTALWAVTGFSVQGFNEILKFAVIDVFLIFGFLASLSTGATGASAVMKTAKSWGKSTAKFAGKVASGQTSIQKNIAGRIGREVLSSKPIGDLLEKGIKSERTGIPGWLIRTGALKGKEMKANMAQDITKMRNDPALQSLLANNDIPGMIQWVKAAPLKLDQDKRSMAVASLIAKDKKEAGMMKVESIDPGFMNKAGDKMATSGLKGLLDDMISDSPILARRKQFWLAMLGLPKTPEEVAKLEKNLESAHEDLLKLANKNLGDLTVGDKDWFKLMRHDSQALSSLNDDSLLKYLKPSLAATNLHGIVQKHDGPLFDTLMAEHAERKTNRGLSDDAVKKLSADYFDNAHSAENFVKTRSDTDAIKVLNVQGPKVFGDLINAAQRIGVVKLNEIGQNQWVRAPYVGNNRHYFNEWQSPIDDKISVGSLDELKKHIGIITSYAKKSGTELAADHASRSATLIKLQTEASALPGQISVKKTEINSISNMIKSGKATQKDKLKLDVLKDELSVSETRAKSIKGEMENNDLELKAISKAPNYIS